MFMFYTANYPESSRLEALDVALWERNWRIIYYNLNDYSPAAYNNVKRANCDHLANRAPGIHGLMAIETNGVYIYEELKCN